MKFLIVSDGKAGHEQQSRALCAGMGCGYDILRVNYPAKWRKGLSYLLDWLNIPCEKLYAQENPLPAAQKYAAVIGAGSTTFYPARVISRKLKIPVVAVLTPRGYRVSKFDCILAPVFDRMPARPNIVATPVNVTQTNDAFYAQGVRDFEARFARDPQKKSVGVIIGGPNAFCRMDADEMRAQLKSFFDATRGMARWVTTSRRTPPEVEQIVREMDFDYRLIFSEDTFNPIPAFVVLCDTLCVTSDSTGMISEAVTRGAARVEILPTLRKPGTKFGRFIAHLEQLGCAHCFNGQLADARKKIDLQPVFQKVAEKIGVLPGHSCQ